MTERIKEVFGWLALRWKQRLFERRLYKAAHRADKLAKAFGCKYVVLMVNGRPRALAKPALRKMVAQHRFRKGTTMQKIMACALYETR